MPHLPHAPAGEQSQLPVVEYTWASRHPGQPCRLEFFPCVCHVGAIRQRPVASLAAGVMSFTKLSYVVGHHRHSVNSTSTFTTSSTSHHGQRPTLLNACSAASLSSPGTPGCFATAAASHSKSAIRG